MKEKIYPHRLFRSAVSGLWYTNPNAAGDIDAVELFGERIFREENETSLGWIHRTAEWAAEIREKNIVGPTGQEGLPGPDWVPKGTPNLLAGPKGPEK
jgi:hypothetical protein